MSQTNVIKVKLAAMAQELTTLTKELAELVTRTVRTILIPASKIELADGESLGGLVLDDEGNPSHHLVLLAGEAESVNWAAAAKWAESVGGELPTRREQSLLFAHCKSQFKGAWYWSSEQPGSLPDYAWVQGFASGYQNDGHKSFSYRARAVRRLKIFKS